MTDDDDAADLQPWVRAARGAPPAPATRLEALWSGVEVDVRRERGPIAWLRARSQVGRVLTVLLVVALQALAITLLRPRDELGLYPGLRMASVLAVYMVLALAAGMEATRPAWLPARVGRAWCLLAIGLLAPLVVALLPEVRSTSAWAARGRGAELIPWAAHCFVIGSAWSLAPLIVARVVDRGAHHALRTAALAALLAGVAGNVALQLGCPLTCNEHLLAGHASVSVAMVVGYWAACLAILRRRR